MSLVMQAMQHPTADRREFLRLACSGDPSLFAEATQVVREQEEMGDFLEKPLLEYEDYEPPFHAGDVLEKGRFEIVREVGAGGMGIVYEAFDRKLNQKIAIKVGKRGFRQFMCPELKTALMLRHRNLCVMNQVHDEIVDGDRIEYLTMEFLEGELLSERLKRSKLEPAEALEIARQLCRGIAAAHDVGIIHRDLKSANVFLTQEAGKLRVVITDFGLSASVEDKGVLIAGTPAYMAPELKRCERATKASDLYALGVVLYECVAGCQPFAGATVTDTFTKTPAPPSKFNANLPSHWDKAVVHCLEPDPDKRPADAQDVLKILEPAARPWLAIAAFAVMLLAMVAAFIPQVHSKVQSWFKPADVRLAILPGQAPDELSVLTGGFLHDVGARISHMHHGDSNVVVISPAEAANLKATNADQATKLLHATHALETKVEPHGNKIGVTASLVDLATMTHLRDFTQEYDRADLGNVPQALAGTASDALRLKGSEVEVVSAAATAAYDRGLFYLKRDRYSFNEAATAFQEAAKQDPHSAIPLAGLTEAYLQKFQTTKDNGALQQAQQALSAAQAINPDAVTVHLADGLLNQTVGKYEKALEAYRRVLNIEPRNVDALVRMGQTYQRSDMSDRALESYQKAVALDPNYYMPHLWLGSYYYRRGDYTHAEAEFRAATIAAPGTYDAWTSLGAALDVLDRDTESEQALRESIRLKETPRALNSLGGVLARAHRDAEAIPTYERAVSLEPSNYMYWLNLADSQRRSGEGRKSAESYRAAEQLTSKELAANPRQDLSRMFNVYARARLGDSQVEREVVQALASSPQDGQVLHRAILTLFAIRETDRAFELARKCTPEMRRQLIREPDLADFSKDARFQN